MEYINNVIGFVLPYIKLIITLSFLWNFITSSLKLYVKIKFNNQVLDTDIDRIGSSIIVFILCIIIFYM